jgi:SAM-dependent methyltransferase
VELRAALLEVPPAQRDAWVDRLLGLGEWPDDGPELPRGCVPYMPCAVDRLLQVIDRVPVRASDVFVDVGAGVGRAGALVHLLTGAAVIGLEVQPHLVREARALAARLSVERLVFVEGDALALTGYIAIGTVFFFYCPFSGDRLARVLRELEWIARTRAIRVCCVDTPLPPCDWLLPQGSSDDDVAIYHSAGSGMPPMPT